jgi:hypothetical protein
LGGNGLAVDAQRTAFSALGPVTGVDTDVWRRLRASEASGGLVFRLSTRPSEIASAWNVACAVADECPGTLIGATVARGIVRCIVPDGASAVASLRRLWSESRIARIGERLTPELWSLCSPPTDDRLSSGVKRTFDPRGVLNPGILENAHERAGGRSTRMRAARQPARRRAIRHRCVRSLWILPAGVSNVSHARGRER